MTLGMQQQILAVVIILALAGSLLRIWWLAYVRMLESRAVKVGDIWRSIECGFEGTYRICLDATPTQSVWLQIWLEPVKWDGERWSVTGDWIPIDPRVMADEHWTLVERDGRLLFATGVFG